MSVWAKISHNLVLHQPSGVYYVRKFKAGRGRIFTTTGERLKGRAQTKADLLISEWLGGRRETGKRVRIEKLIDELDDLLERDAHTRGNDGHILRRKRTREKDRTYWPIIKQHFGALFPDEIDEAFWQRWCLTEGRKLDRNLGDIGKYLSHVLKFAYMTKAIGRKPRIKNPDAPPREKVIYTPAQIQAFWTHAHVDMKDLIISAGESGVRPHENQGLRFDWMTIPARGPVKLRIPDDFEKRGIGREIFLSQAASDMIRRRAKTKVGPYVFPSPKDQNKPLSSCQISRYWRRTVKAVNAELVKAKQKPFPIGRDGGIKFHWLRHFFFNHSLRVAKKDLDEVASYGGNSPKILFKDYVAKDAAKTKGMASAVALNLTEGK